jgi:transcriptional regulator GlxA family with amidase domain
MISAKNIFLPNPEPLRISVLVLDDSNTLSFAAAVDPMRAANRQARKRLFDWTYATAAGNPALLTSGVHVPGDAIAHVTPPDLLLVIAGFNLASHDTPNLRASLRRLARAGSTLAGIDGGPWLLAGAGLLDGHHATMHWEDHDAFAHRFPQIRVERSRYCIDGPRITSGGAAPTIDLMLSLIAGRFGTTLAEKVTTSFIYDPVGDANRPQSRRISARHNTLTARANALMEDHLDAPMPIPQIARRLGVSTRSLELQFRARLGTTPKSYFLSLRLAEAYRRVTATSEPLNNIALACGFASQSSFSRTFKSSYGQSARRLRSA